MSSLETVLILASASPRRRWLLTSAGVRFVVRAADIDESPRPVERPLALARRLARKKALAGPGRCVLAADTVVALDGVLLGKPTDPEEARRMLAALSGRTHRVHTAVALAVNGRVHQLTRTTLVHFRVLPASEIAAYVATGEPLDKAGAYGIQGAGGALVDWVRGSYTNVVGLPLAETLALLARWKGP